MLLHDRLDVSNGSNALIRLELYESTYFHRAMLRKRVRYCHADPLRAAAVPAGITELTRRELQPLALCCCSVLVPAPGAG